MSADQVTLKDIAKRLNVSPSTVSRALKNNPEIGAATREAVVKLAKEMNYQPNAVALSLRKKNIYHRRNRTGNNPLFLFVSD